MASKQLGKLRQWGREVISSKEKTVLSQEFKDIEQDIELRRAGVSKLYEACGEYHKHLQKKKEYASVEEGVTMLALDAVGAVMMSHGEEFGEDSAFGQGLLRLGRAHCKIATLQETFAISFRDTYLASLEVSLADFETYASQRKKLDSRRLAYDAAVTKASKAKKEKEVREAEEEVTKAKIRYEETSADVQVRMSAIQENEIQQLRDLTKLLTVEMRFAEQYLDILRGTHNEWVDESAIQQAEVPRRKAPPHEFAFGRSTPSISSTSKTTVAARPSSAAAVTDDTDDAELGFTVKRRGSLANTSRPSSRGSTTSVGTAHSAKRSRNTGSVGDTGSTGKRLNVAGWASSAVSSLSGSGRTTKKEVKKEKGASKEKEKRIGRAFSSLDNSEGENENDRLRYEEEIAEERERSFDSSVLSRVVGHTPSTSLRHLGNPPNSSSSSSSFNSVSASGSSASPTTHRIVRATVDFSGSPDELSFHAGDEILVVSEPKGGWCMGEVSGRRGLFPINCAEEVSSGGRTRIPPPLPSRMTNIAQRAQNDIVSEDGESILSDDYQYVTTQTSRVYDEPFGDHHLAKSPMVVEHDHEHDHEHDPTGDIAMEEEEKRGLFGGQSPTTYHDVTSTSVGSTRYNIEIGNIAGNSVADHSGAGVRQPPALPHRKQLAKKPPPPPPARRSTISGLAPPQGLGASGGPSTSAPSSTANLAAIMMASSSSSAISSSSSSAVSFPPPPPAGRRRGIPSRSRSAASSLSQLPPPPPTPDTVSPFDN